MKHHPHSCHGIRAIAVVLVAALTLLIRTGQASAEEPVILSAADFQRLVYSAHLHSQLALKHELEASLRVLLELGRRNPHADPAALAGILTNALGRFRANAPYYVRTNGYPDEILAAYLESVRQIPARTNYLPANLSLLNNFMLGPADYDPTVTTGDEICSLVDSGNQRLFSTEAGALKRQALVDECVARAWGHPGFAAAMDGLLKNEISASLADSPAQIIGSTNSPLHGNATMTDLLALSAASGDGSVRTSNDHVVGLFTNEMETMWATIHTNLAVLAQINQGQADLLDYLTNQAASDADVALTAGVQAGQPARLASATAAVLTQTKLIALNTDSAQKEQVVSDVGNIAFGIASLCTKDPAGGESVMSGALDLFNLFSGNQSPQDVMANQIQNIQNLVSDLTTNVNYRFDRVDQSLTTMFNTMNQEFGKIEYQVDSNGKKIAQLDADVEDVRSSLMGVQAELDRLESRIFDDFITSTRSTLVDEMNDCLFWDEQNPYVPMEYLLGQYNYLEMEGDFYNYAASTAEKGLCSPNPTTLDPPETQLVDFPLDANLNYISKFLASLGQNTSGKLPFANPRDWFTGAYAYMQLAVEHPMYFREKGLRLPAIISAGQNLSNFFGSLTFAGTNINWPLYASLEHYYFTGLTNFNAKYAAFEGDFATNNAIGLGLWRQWDVAAPRITAATTKVRSAPDIPALLPRKTATNIAAGVGFSLALLADGTVAGWGDNSSGQTAIPGNLANVVAISAGDSNGVALTATGAVISWGDNTYGQTNVPASLAGVVAVAAGGRHGLALNANGTVTGWGYNYYNQTNVPASLSNVIAIAAGANHSLALKADGTVVGWGAGSPGTSGGANYGQASIPAGLTNVVAIAAGDLHSLALKADGTLVGWGNNYFGQATGVPRPVPPFTSTGVVMTATLVLSNVVAVAAGQSYSLALLSDATVYGWGQNHSGEATGVPSHQVPPIGAGLATVSGVTVSKAKKIAAGGEHSLALKSDGMMVTWGDNTDGQGAVPRSFSLTWRGAVAGGELFGLALQADGSVLAWGDNSCGQGNIPPGLTNIIAVAAGNYHSLALTADGRVAGWGAGTNNNGQNSNYGQAMIPSDLSNVVAIAAGAYHSLALKADGTVVGWGAGTSNTHQNYNYGQVIIPSGLTNVVAIAAGSVHSLVLKADGTLVGWGAGMTNIPSGATNVAAIAAGYQYSLALKTDGTVFGWGYNQYGEATGVATTGYPYISTNGATVTLAGTNVVALAANDNHSLALKADGSMVGWGVTGFYGLPYGPTIPSGLSNAVAITTGLAESLTVRADGSIVGWQDHFFGQVSIPAGLTNVVAVAANSDDSLALQADGRVVAWGNNYYGAATVPATVTNAVAIAAGDSHNLALKADGTVVSWGNNAQTQTNTPLGLHSVIAIAAGDYHSAALLANGTIVAWGNNDAGQTSTAGLSGVVDIASGGDFGLALKGDGTVAVWGGKGNYYGQTNVPAGLAGVVAIAALGEHSLALKADGTVVGWGDNSDNETNTPVGLTNMVAIAAGEGYSLALTADGKLVEWGDNSHCQTNLPPELGNVVAMSAGGHGSLFITAPSVIGSAGSAGLAFARAQIPSRVTALFKGCNQAAITELGLPGSDLDKAAAQLSGAKLLLADVLELGLPYTLERDDILRGFLYGSESLADTGAATNFLQTQNDQLQLEPTAPPQALVQIDALRLLRFQDRLNYRLSQLQTNGQPEIPRLVGHTLRLLNLLNDAWTQPAKSPPPAIEMWSEDNWPCLVLYGEPYMRYTLQYRDTLNAAGWTNTSILSLQDEQVINPPISGGPRRFYRAMLPMP